MPKRAPPKPRRGPAKPKAPSPETRATRCTGAGGALVQRSGPRSPSRHPRVQRSRSPGRRHDRRHDRRGGLRRNPTAKDRHAPGVDRSVARERPRVPGPGGRRVDHGRRRPCRRADDRRNRRSSPRRPRRGRAVAGPSLAADDGPGHWRAGTRSTGHARDQASGSGAHRVHVPGHDRGLRLRRKARLASVAAHRHRRARGSRARRGAGRHGAGGPGGRVDQRTASRVPRSN